jgi:hypothetical protein
LFPANGLPDHATGEFPNRGNPNAIAPQNVDVCVPLNPMTADQITLIRGTMGIAINGVQFRPNTEGFYDPNGRRGHSRNSGWRIQLFCYGQLSLRLALLLAQTLTKPTTVTRGQGADLAVNADKEDVVGCAVKSKVVPAEIEKVRRWANLGTL